MPVKSIRKRSFVKGAGPSGAGALLGYARVSKGDEQNNALQTKVLKTAGCRRLFEEAASGGRWDRPELHRMLDHLREGDTVVVWKLDRLSRSLKDVLHIMERIGERRRRLSLAHREHRHHNSSRTHDDADGWSIRRVRTCHDPRTDIGWSRRRQSRGTDRWPEEDTGAAKRREIAESVVSGRKSGADMARLYNVSEPTVSRIVAEHRMAQP